MNQSKIIATIKANNKIDAFNRWYRTIYPYKEIPLHTLASFNGLFQTLYPIEIYGYGTANFAVIAAIEPLIKGNNMKKE